MRQGSAGKPFETQAGSAPLCIMHHDDDDHTMVDAQSICRAAFYLWEHLLQAYDCWCWSSGISVAVALATNLFYSCCADQPAGLHSSSRSCMPEHCRALLHLVQAVVPATCCQVLMHGCLRSNMCFVHGCLMANQCHTLSNSIVGHDRESH